ncbi:MAG: MFS transporter [Promethearchaeota archaeon]
MVDNSNHESKNLRGYLLIWFGQLVSILGSAIVQFAIIWWLTLETGSAFVLALASFAGLAPAVVIGLFSGVLADRWSRKKILLAADFFQAIATLGLIVLFLIDIVEIWHVLALLAVRSIFQAFQLPADVAIVGQMIPKNQISRINGLKSVFNTLIFIISPVLGALFLEIFPVGQILWLDVITFLIAVFSLIFVTIPPMIRKAGSGLEKMSFKAQFVEGFSYLKSSGLLPLVFIFTIANILLNPLFSIMPLFIKEVHLGGAIELAFIIGAFQLGNFSGSLLVAIRKISATIRLILGGISTAFLGLFIIAITPTSFFLWMGIGALVLGFAIGIVDVVLISFLQIIIAPEMQGRVMSVTFVLAKSILPLGLLAIGSIAEIIGLATLYLVSPILGFLLVGYGILVLRTPLQEYKVEQPAPLSI